MSPPSFATAGRTRVSINSLMVATVSASLASKNSSSSPVAGRLALGEQRRAGHVVLHDGAEDHRLELLPLAVGLGHGDEIGAEEHTADAADLEQALGQWGFRGAIPSRMSSVPASSTVRPGRNFRVAGLGVVSVWMNIGL